MSVRITSIDNATIKNPTLQTTDDDENTYTISLPNRTDTVATLSGSETLSNKILKSVSSTQRDNVYYEGIQIQRLNIATANLDVRFPVVGNTVSNPVHVVATDSVATLTNKTFRGAVDYFGGIPYVNCFTISDGTSTAPVRVPISFKANYLITTNDSQSLYRKYFDPTCRIANGTLLS